MSKSDTWENGLLLLLFNNTTFGGVGDTTGLPGAATVGSLYASLHTADPGETGTQTTSEATYSSYTRVAIARTSGGFTVSTNTVTNTASVTFPQCTGGSNTITHFGIGTLISGAGKLLYSGALGSSLSVSNNVTPTFSASGITITED